jgi:hypothetical protein
MGRTWSEFNIFLLLYASDFDYRIHGYQSEASLSMCWVKIEYMPSKNHRGVLCDRESGVDTMEGRLRMLDVEFAHEAGTATILRRCLASSLTSRSARHRSFPIFGTFFFMGAVKTASKQFSKQFFADWSRWTTLKAFQPVSARPTNPYMGMQGGLSSPEFLLFVNELVSQREFHLFLGLSS